MGTIEQHQKVMNDHLDAMAAHVKTIQGLHAAAATHGQKMQHTEAKHRQTLTLAAVKARKEAKSKPAAK